LDFRRKWPSGYFDFCGRDGGDRASAKSRWRLLLEHPQDLLATLVLGNTFANAAMLAVALRMVFNAHWALALTMIGAAGAGAAGLRSLSQNPGGAARRTLGRARGWLMLIFEKASKPLHRAAQWLNVAISKKTAPQSRRAAGQADGRGISGAARHGLPAGHAGGTEKEIILQIISLDQRAARDVMRPRAGMAAMSDDASGGGNDRGGKKFKHRRLPIYDETPDTIVGILNTRALLLDPKIELADAIEFPSFVPETMNLLQLFRALQKQQRGMAIVLDEFGGTAGW
jgi:putative hemolysin